MTGGAELAELTLALRSNKRPPCQSPPWLVAPLASAARHLHRAVTTDATAATRYACPDDSPTAGDVNQIVALRHADGTYSTTRLDRSRPNDLDDLVHNFLHLRSGNLRVRHRTCFASAVDGQFFRYCSVDESCADQVRALKDTVA
jgi:hypothetical protein